MSRSTCPGCGKTCTRTTCHACRYEGDPIPTIAEVLAGDARSFGDVRLDLYAQAVHDRARRELARELRRRLDSRVEEYKTARTQTSHEVAMYQGATAGIRRAERELRAALRATRGR